MTVLTKEIAQDIVERTMKIMTQNINVMDESGIIIGSGDNSRIGKIHEGATKVIKQEARVDIPINQSEILAGTKPGINLPIVFENKVIGVIGISGDPKEISQFGELVKMGAEMMLQQASLTEQLQWDVRLREELVTQIIYNKLDALSYERANRLGIDLSIDRIPILIEFIPTDMVEEMISKTKKNVMSYLRDYLDKKDVVASSGPTRIIILKEFRTHTQRTQLMNQFEELIEVLRGRNTLKCQAGIGSEFTSVEDAQISYKYAEDALEVGKNLYPNDYVYDYEELLLPILLSQLKIRDNKLSNYYQALVDYDKRGELQATLQMYIDHNGELNRIANKLFIHRNTLSYRLERIENITGKDPRKTKDLLKLHISQLLYQLK